MAFFWSAKNHTKTLTNQWFDTTFGLKASNVFGLAWSYYTASIKSITGVDISADIQFRCDFFRGHLQNRLCKRNRVPGRKTY